MYVLTFYCSPAKKNCSDSANFLGVWRRHCVAYISDTEYMFRFPRDGEDGSVDFAGKTSILTIL